MEKTVFISHSHKDASVAVLMRDALESNGISCWICSRDISSGKVWDAEIVDAIEACKVFLFLLSENSANSKQCYKEIALADAAGCAMICVNIDHSELCGGAKYHFINLQTMFVDQMNLLNELDGVISRIRGIVNGDRMNMIGDTVPCYHFSFKLDLKGLCQSLNGAQKVQMIEIITNSNREFGLSIKLEDENVEALERQCLQIKKRLEDGQDVSDQDVVYMTQARTVCERQKRENLRKAMAAKLFLYDSSIQTACQLHRLDEVWEVLKAILEYQPRFDIQQKANDQEHTMLEFVLPKEKIYFSAPVRNKIIAERRLMMGYFCEIGLLPIADLGMQYLREILPYFYMFLAEELVAGNEMMQQEQVRNLLKYQFGYK